MSIPALDENTLISVADCPGFAARMPFDSAVWQTQSFAAAQSSGFRHRGVDHGMVTGTLLRAVAKGRVSAVDTIHWSYGRHVLIDHYTHLDTDGRARRVSSLYAHMWYPKVRVGDEVERGEVIGYSDNTGLSTGPHLHWEIRYDFLRVSPLTQIREPAPPPPPPDPWEEFMATLTTAQQASLVRLADLDIEGKTFAPGTPGRTVLIGLMDAYKALPAAQQAVALRRLQRFTGRLGASLAQQPQNVMDKLNRELSRPEDATAPAPAGEGHTEAEGPVDE